MYSLTLRRKASKGLDKLSGDAFQSVLAAIKSLIVQPRPRGVEKLKTSGLLRIRQGDSRIIYNVDDAQQAVVILRVGHRKEIYREF